MKPTFLFISLLFIFTSCATHRPTVRQEDLEAWKGVSVEALDTHSLWTTIPMKEIKTKDGLVYRYYNNSKTFKECSASVYAPKTNAYSYGQTAYGSSTCSEDTVSCNNLFILKKGKVVSYEPKGRCYTDETVQPEGRYRKVATVSPSKPSVISQPTASSASHGCMKDSDCSDGKICASVRGEYPGSCAKGGFGF